MPMLRYPQLRMLARCPGLFIQDCITEAASFCPLAMFSPTDDHLYPALVTRVATVTPSGVLWSKYPRFAMSAECSRAAVVSRLSTDRLGQPAFARSWLTRSKTAASSAASPVGFVAGGGAAVRVGSGGASLRAGEAV